MRKPERPLRVMHILLSIGETSAPYNEHCLPWADKRDITIATFFGSDISAPSTVRLFEGDGTLRGFFRALYAANRSAEHDIIHAHSPHVGLLFLVANVLRLWRLLPKTVFTVHNCYPNYERRHLLMLMPVFALFRRTVCCSQASYDSFPPFFKRLAGQRLKAVPNGLDIERVDRILGQQPKRPNPIPFIVLGISRLVALKNPLTVVEAFRQGSDPCARLTLVGKGPLHDDLQRLGADIDLELTGIIPRNTVFERLRQADLFISASRGEGLPISVLEAMACGCPVLLSDIGPHREIAAGVDFLPLVDPDDVAGFAREIQRFNRMTPADRVAIGCQCRALVEARFSLPAMHRGYDEIYAQVAGGRLVGMVPAHDD